MLNKVLKELVDQKVNDIFLAVQSRLNIRSGDISPGLYRGLEKAEENLAETIEAALYAQMGDNELEKTQDLCRFEYSERTEQPLFDSAMLQKTSLGRIFSQNERNQDDDAGIKESSGRYVMKNYLFAYLSAGCTVFKRGERYQAVAHIASSGKITWYCSPALLPEEVNEKIHEKSEEHKSSFLEWLHSFSEDQQYVRLSEKVPYTAWRYAADMEDTKDKLTYLEKVLTETSYFGVG